MPNQPNATPDQLTFTYYVDYSRHMELEDATICMNALSQVTRLQAFRLLITAGPDGLPAGEIAASLAVPHNTLSTHLSTLVQSGLMQSRRVSRSIFYSVNEDGVRALLQFLLQDCCQGRPELCVPPASSLGKKRKTNARPKSASRGQ